MALSPVYLANSGGPAGATLGPAAIFTGNVTHLLLSVWLHDPQFTTPSAHAHNLQLQADDSALSPATWWELGLSVDFSNTLQIAVVRHGTTLTETAWTALFEPPSSWPSCLTHLLLSIDFLTFTAQCYLNDAALTFSGTTPAGFFTAGIPLTNTLLAEQFGNTGLHGYMSALWLGQTASFVDLTVTANRRKFINADGTPAGLGSNGQTPFGTAPAIYQNIAAGGAGTAWLSNLGTAGGTFARIGTTVIDAPGDPCAPPPVPTSSLAMDNLLAFAAVTTSQLVFLEWSDDRGHSYGNPVSQPIGDRGEYLTSASWNRLGYARDRVFRITWSVPVATALQGAFITLDAQAKS